MFFGVFIYSFSIGSLSSLLNQIEIKSIRYSNLMNKLMNISKRFDIENYLFHRIKNQLKYGLGFSIL